MEFVTRQQLCARLGCSIRTLDRFVLAGAMPRPVQIGRRLKFVASEVEAALATLPRK